MNWIKRHLNDDAKVWHGLWSIRIALFWAVVCGLYVAIPAFQSYVDAPLFAVICIVFSLAICIARITNQPGLT